MCGEFDEEDYIDERLFGRFVQLAGQHGVRPTDPGSDAPHRLSEQAERTHYMEQLFRAGLTRAVNDAGNLPQGERMDAVAGQAIVFARLAGFLAGQLPPGADVLRPAIEALLEGHNEPKERTHAHHHHGESEH